MANLVAHAIQVESDDGTGNPVAYSSTSLGVEDGIFYLITGRHGLDGTKTIAGDTSRGTWYEGILTKNYGDFSPSQNIDFIEAGDMETAGNFSFSIVNTGGFWNTIRTNGIYLARCRVTYFHVTSADGTTFTFRRMWTGIIEDQPFSETVQQVRCLNNRMDIFGTLPHEVVDGTRFPDASKDAENKTIPIAIGRIANSPLINVHAGGAFTTLTSIDGVEGTICAAKDHNTTAKWIDLFTEGVSFPADSVDIVGRFLVVAVGGSDQSIKISSNDATDAGAETTRVYLETLWEGTIEEWADSEDAQTLWYFQVREYSADFISSTKPIFEQIKNANGQTAISVYDSTQKRYSDLSEIKTISDVSDFKTYGRPGLEALLRRVETDGNISVFTPIKPASVTLHENYEDLVIGSSVAWDGPAEGEDQPDLYDQDRSTGYTNLGDQGDYRLSFDLKFPDVEVKKDYDDIYLLLDFRHRSATAGAGDDFLVSLQVTATAIDIHGRETSEVVTAVDLFALGVDDPLGTDWVEIFTLPGVYYNTKEDPERFFTKRQGLSVSSLISDTTKFKAYPKLRVQIRTVFFDLRDYEMELFEIGFVGKKSVSLVNDDLYHTIKGETFGTQWRSPDAPSTGRVSATDFVPTIDRALEHLIRNYDYNHPTWTAGKAYKVGQKVRSTVDNGFIYICTVAGTSHASTEPTFPTTLGNTVTDGTVTWEALDTLKLNCAAFDTLNTQREDWFIGRTLTEKKKSEEYYRELCRHGFFLMVMDAQGRVKPKAWRENTTSLATFTSTNILKGSLGEMTLSPMRRVYNDLLVKYDLNPAAGSHNKQLFITHVDEPEFPGISETIVPGEDMGSFYISREDLGGGAYRFRVVMLDVFTQTTGDYVSLSGNPDDFDFAPRQIIGITEDGFYVDGFFTTATSSGSSGTPATGTILHHTDTRLTWKSYVGGINSYALAKELWDLCHASYVIHKTVQKLPTELSECPWFIDPLATDPSGNRIWTDLTDGDEHPAVFYLQNLVEWTTRQKKQITFEVPRAAAYVTVSSESADRYLEVGDPVTFNDAKLTNGSGLLGWIHERVFIPGEGNKVDRFKISLTLNPEELQAFNIIDENGAAATDIIDENSAVSTDIIDENGA